MSIGCANVTYAFGGCGGTAVEWSSPLDSSSATLVDPNGMVTDVTTSGGIISVTFAKVGAVLDGGREAARLVWPWPDIATDGSEGILWRLDNITHAQQDTILAFGVMTDAGASTGDVCAPAIEHQSSFTRYRLRVMSDSNSGTATSVNSPADSNALGPLDVKMLPFIGSNGSTTDWVAGAVAGYCAADSYGVNPMYLNSVMIDPPPYSPCLFIGNYGTTAATGLIMACRVRYAIIKTGPVGMY